MNASDSNKATRTGHASNANAKSAAVHDLGYKPYQGSRRPQSTRYRAMVRNQLATSWRGWWRMKAWVICGVMVAVGFGIAIYVIQFVLETNPMVSSAMRMGGASLRVVDYLLPLSFAFAAMLAFILGLTVVAGSIADDLRAGAFEFYFSRPVRPRDYVLGRLLGAGLIIGIVLLGTPLVVALARVALAGGRSQLVATLDSLPRTLAAGAVATVLYTVVPLAISAGGARRRFAIAGWAAFYLVPGLIAHPLGRHLDIPELSVVSLSATNMAITHWLFGIVPQDASLPPVHAALVAAMSYAAISVVFIHARVKRAETTGMRGG